MDENEILQMGQTLKRKYEELESKSKQIKEDYTLLQKDLLSIYGYIRIIDTTICDCIEIPMELEIIINILRDYASSTIGDHIKPHPLL